MISLASMAGSGLPQSIRSPVLRVRARPRRTRAIGSWTSDPRYAEEGNVMAPIKLTWRLNEAFPNGKGATIQQYLATDNDDQLEMDVAPWGEGHVRLNGVEIGQVRDGKDRQQVFRRLDAIGDIVIAADRRESQCGGRDRGYYISCRGSIRWRPGRVGVPGGVPCR